MKSGILPCNVRSIAEYCPKQQGMENKRITIKRQSIMISRNYTAYRADMPIHQISIKMCRDRWWHDSRLLSRF